MQEVEFTEDYRLIEEYENDMQEYYGDDYSSVIDESRAISTYNNSLNGE